MECCTNCIKEYECNYLCEECLNLVEEIDEAQARAARTGNVQDLRRYMELRKERRLIQLNKVV